MKKIMILAALVVVLLAACSRQPGQPAATATPALPPTQTPIPPTATATATATATSTPVPVTIDAEKFSRLEQSSTSTLDLSKFVGFFSANKKGYFSDINNIPTGNFTEGYFDTVQLLENGDVAGLLRQTPLDCGEKKFGTQVRRSCSFNRFYLSMVNLTKKTTLWTQFQPINMAGKELNDLTVKLGIKDFAPFTGGAYNQGVHVYEWSDDNRQIVVPINVVRSIVVKDNQSGGNTLLIHNNSKNSWIGALSPDKTMLAIVEGGPFGSALDMLTILNMADQSILYQHEVSHYATDIAWSDDGSKLAVGKYNGSLDLVDLAAGDFKYLLERRFDVAETYQGKGITRLKFSKDGIRLAFTEDNYTKAGEEIGRLVIYNLETLKVENSYSANFHQRGNILWSLDGSFVVTVTDFVFGKIVLLSTTGVVEYPLTAPETVADYYPEIFPSVISFNQDQTKLTLVRSLFNEAEVTVYEVGR